MSEAQSTHLPAREDWREKAIERLNRVVPNAGNCSACGPAGFGKVRVSDGLMTPVATDEKGAVTLGGTVYPNVALICENCGYTRYFNYLILTGDA